MARLRSVGLGGGGAIYHPQISPWPPTAAHPELMFVACDMDGLYRSADQGQSWTLIDDRTAQGTTRFSVTFDQANPGRVLGYHKTFGLRLSTDYGRTFGPHPVPLPAGVAQVTAAGFTGNGTLVVGSPAGLYRLAGGSWTHVSAASGGVAIGDVRALAFSLAQPAWCFALTPDDVLWSANDGTDWWPCSNQLPPRAADPLYGLAAADAAGQVVLYATMAGGVHRLALVAADQPSSPPAWMAVTGGLAGQGLSFRDVALAAADANTVYVSAYNPASPDTTRPYATVFKGAYAGNAVTWTWAYDGFEAHATPAPPAPATRNVEPGWADLDPPRGRGWGFGGTPRGLVASPRDANVVALTNNAVVHRSDNGAQQSANAWRQRYTLHAPATPDQWATVGLDVTTVWHYYRRDSVRFVASTDIGLARSADGGDTWSWVGVSDVVRNPNNPGQYVYRGTQRTNCYELADVGGTLFAAVSEHHDIPHRSELDLRQPPVGVGIGHGAVLSSPDGREWTTVAGATMTAGSQLWTVDTTSGLPDGPVVALIADAQGVLYASVWARGVVWSANQGQTWHQLGAFQDAGGQPIANPLCHKLALDSAGNLFCATAAQRQTVQVQGSLWRLPAAQMASGVAPVLSPWENKTPLLGSVSMGDFAFDPTNHQRVFACSESVQPGGQGGVFYSRDGGVTWSVNLMPYTDPQIGTYHPDSLQAFSPAVINDRLFVTTLYNGIWSSAYDGTNPAWTPQWQEFKALPFAGAQRIVSRISAGGSRSELYLGTFGAGAWELQRECLFVKDHSSVSRYEVEAQLAAGQATAQVTQVALLVLDGFAGVEVGVSAGALPTVSVTGATGVTARLAGLQQSDPDLERPQRLTMLCDLLFTDLTGFPTAAGQSTALTLTFAHGDYGCSTQVELVYPDHPYVLDGATYWLSEGVRVFRATEGVTRFGATPAVSATPGAIPGNARAYLAQVLAVLNGPGGAATWGQLSTDQLASALQIWPTDDQNRNVLNFAVARLTYRGAVDATAVRVFFRLCAVIATGLDYDPNGASRSFDPAGTGSPIVPRLGLTTNVGTGLREITTIPCFAQPRVNTDGSTPNAQSMDAQADPAFTIAAPGAASVDVYVGAWLDINQPADKRFPLNPPAASGEGPWNPPLLSVEELVLGRHQCLVVELHHRFQGGADTLSPGDGPNTTQYLSQRNLAILGSDNPGGPDSHTVVHPFDLRGRVGRPLGTAGSEGSDDDLDDLQRERLDELLVWWDDVPEETDATLAFSGITADEVLELNAGRPAPTRLERVDATTVRCPVGGLASVPLPYREENVAALLTLVLPPGVRAGRRLGCRLQQLGGPEQAIIGAFGVAIPVEKAAQLLPDATDTLAVMRHIARLHPAADRWTPLLQRYVGLLAAKVDGLGGRADEVEPSPYASGSRPDARARARADAVRSHGRSCAGAPGARGR